MRAYTCIDRSIDQWDGNAWLYFAHNEAQARGQLNIDYYGDEEAVRRVDVAHAPACDRYAKAGELGPYEEQRAHIVVEAGLIPDGWSSCQACDEIVETLDDGVCPMCGNLEDRQC